MLPISDTRTPHLQLDLSRGPYKPFFFLLTLQYNNKGQCSIKELLLMIGDNLDGIFCYRPTLTLSSLPAWTSQDFSMLIYFSWTPSWWWSHDLVIQPTPTHIMHSWQNYVNCNGSIRSLMWKHPLHFKGSRTTEAAFIHSNSYPMEAPIPCRLKLCLSMYGWLHR